MADLILLKDFLTTQIELWKPVEGHDGYAVSSLGNVRTYWKSSCHMPSASFRDECRLLTPTNERGYLRVKMNGTTYRVHRLVATAFIGNPRSHTEVNHRNGIKSDNRADNLEWSTRRANVVHAHKFGLVKNTASHDVVRAIRRRRDAGESGASLSREYGISQGEVCLIAQRKIFKFVSDSDPV